MIAAAIVRRQKPFSHGLDLAERVIRGKRRVPGDRFDPMVLQHPSGRGSLPANINLLHAVSIAKRDSAGRPDLHGEFTGMDNDVGSGLPFAWIFDQCGGMRLFPVQFVTEW
ncbi:MULTISPECIES: hypothetical protein [unclassified Mesorhizobium]|uniref:hypothetical protein n=1 Tax=unclassified Mesorhizobium TaxID=325217 RepID=UPI001CCBB9E0|nr:MULTISPECIES: hypothetical protein [unclassified Mesorhizobium]MBZ9743504.1 hypothetical protein [Mesorhizobium sp. CO1-1-4]MBZ9806186.1 hypothetical protein [Mesorhizobium sp. ES1-6]